MALWNSPLIPKSVPWEENGTDSSSAQVSQPWGAQILVLPWVGDKRLVRKRIFPVWVSLPTEAIFRMPTPI